MDKYERRIRVAELHDAVLTMAGWYAEAMADYTQSGTDLAWRSQHRRSRALARLTSALAYLAEK